MGSHRQMGSRRPFQLLDEPKPSDRDEHEVVRLFSSAMSSDSSGEEVANRQLRTLDKKTWVKNPQTG